MDGFHSHRTRTTEVINMRDIFAGLLIDHAEQHEEIESVQEVA